MKNGGLFLLIFLWGQSICAQVNMDQMFQKDNPNLIYQNEPRSFEGKPLVFLEGVSDKPIPKTWQDHLKLRLFGSMDIPASKGPELDLTPSVSVENTNQQTVRIQPAFGAPKQVPFIQYTPDWHFVITATDTDVFYIHEDLSFILRAPQKDITRNWPVSLDNFQLRQVRLDGQILPQKIQSKENEVFLTLPEVDIGAHKIQLDYLIIAPQNKDTLLIPLMGNKWPFVADTFSGIIFNNQSKINSLEFLIGTNNKTYPENFTISPDNQGNLFFKMNKVLPANTQIQLQTKSNYPTQKTLLKQSLNGTLWGIIVSVLFLYILGSGLEIKYMSLEKKLKKFHSFSPHFFINFLNRNKEILIGSALLIVLGFLFMITYKIETDFYWFYLLILFSIILIIITDFLFIHPVQKEIYKIHEAKKGGTR